MLTRVVADGSSVSLEAGMIEKVTVTLELNTDRTTTLVGSIPRNSATPFSKCET